MSAPAAVLNHHAQAQRDHLSARLGAGDPTSLQWAGVTTHPLSSWSELAAEGRAVMLAVADTSQLEGHPGRSASGCLSTAIKPAIKV